MIAEVIAIVCRYLNFCWLTEVDCSAISISLPFSLCRPHRSTTCV